MTIDPSKLVFQTEKIRLKFNPRTFNKDEIREFANIVRKGI